MNKAHKKKLEVGATYQTQFRTYVCKKIDRVSNDVWFDFPNGPKYYSRDSTGYYPFLLNSQEQQLNHGALILIKRPPLWTRFVNKLKSIFGWA